MIDGMLWFDSDPSTGFTEKLRKAVIYYRNRFGVEPNLCHVHPSCMPSESTDTLGLTVAENKAVRPKHFWIGVNAPQKEPA